MKWENFWRILSFTKTKERICDLVSCLLCSLTPWGGAEGEGWESKVCAFITTWVLLKTKQSKAKEKGARGQYYGFELYAGIKLNATQELSQKVAAIAYSQKLWSGKKDCLILVIVKATFRSFDRYCHLFCQVVIPNITGKSSVAVYVSPCMYTAALQKKKAEIDAFH